MTTQSKGHAMKTLALAILLAVPLAAQAGPPTVQFTSDLYTTRSPGLYQSHGPLLAMATPMVKRSLGYVIEMATTTTTANAARTAILTSDSGTESAPTAATVGLNLTGVSAVSVILKTSSNATAGGTLQAYVFNAETATWARVADLDLTATATTNQSWPAIYVPVSRGRLYYNPVGIGSVTTTVYLVGQPR